MINKSSHFLKIKQELKGGAICDRIIMSVVCSFILDYPFFPLSSAVIKES